MVMKSSRDNEFSADEFAFNLGFGYDLCMMLDGISGPEPKGLFKTWYQVIQRQKNELKDYSH